MPPRQQRAKTSRRRLRHWVPLGMACGFIAYFWVLLFLSIGLQLAAEPRHGTISIATSPINKANAAGHKLVQGSRGEPGDLRFIVYRDGGRGQGLGNVMKGLLMAIDLGHEFNRTVCVEWEAFHAAFNPPQKDLCRNNLKGARKNANFWNFGQSMKLEQMRAIVASEVDIVVYTGNSQRGVPFYTPEIYRDIFLPTKALEEKVPWKEPPACVVHLRTGDGPHDQRKGLDEATLRAMERKFPADCYLITNNFDWYGRFEKVGWGHPPWGSMKRHQLSSSAQLELWSDWYTIMHAKKVVYHAQSGFSESAAWAGGCLSRRIVGGNTTTGGLILETDHGSLSEQYEKRAGLSVADL